MKIASAEDIGRIIKQKRKNDRLTLEEAAAVCGVSYAFMSALENGKETVRLNKVLQVIKCLGIELEAKPRTWATPGAES
ncbi:helix-turn-helix domain-containing protein [Geobacter sp. DSM 9736]|uniref:helix-turn-helix domain-containing protein n=1 Tax=Geobacter sp. DSM 9736 TaxID=1277350 RepID=UPI000B5056D9|nr:helix-turn-helix domain-containing protein [Geobacter sp. DSM 9736]SNB45466.1 Helix-turn-helix [Geobacter sp. DSM 9736]